MDTVVSAGSFEAALHAAGGAVAMVDALLGAEGAHAGASLHRPPGHHAEAARAMGFCLLDNVAIAAQHALDAHGAQRVMIVDWDVHHGNGTNAIFHERADVLFCSIHQSPLYPGTGPASDAGRGDGAGFTVNMPVPGGLRRRGVPVARRARRRAARARLRARPAADLRRLRRARRRSARRLPGDRRRLRRRWPRCCAGSPSGSASPLGLVLEGGYDLDALARSIVATLAVLGAPRRRPRRTSPCDPLALGAQERLAAGHWPALIA